MYLGSCLALVLLSVSVAHDLKSREIPDWIPLALLAVGIVEGLLGTGFASWGDRAIGTAGALAVCATLFYIGAMGGGDAKLIAGIGTVVGWRPLLSISFYTAVIGGVLSYIAWRRGARELAYAPAIAIGHGLWLLLAFLAPGALGMWGSAPA